MQHVSHIKEIVSMQQAYARSSGVYEKVALKDLMDDVLDISRPGLERHGIAIEIDSEELPPITTDQHKVLQILLNLVRNATDAVKESGNPDRQIKIRMFRIRDDRIAIRVADNGIGIPTEDLVRIFSWVYYKKDGHGFGLHSGALAAQQLGGSVTAQSDGTNAGAIFTLEFPIQSGRKSERELLDDRSCQVVSGAHR